MFHVQESIPAFRTVAPGVPASTILPVGPTYREITLGYKTGGSKATEAQFISDIELVTLKINGISRWEITGANLLKMNKYYGYGFNAGELVIPLSRHYVRTPQSEELLAWGTKNVSSFQIEVKIASGAITPELTAEADYSVISQDLGQIIEVHEFNYDFTGSGGKEIPDLPKENGALVALHMTSAEITAMEVKIGQLRPLDTDTDLDVYLNRLARVAERVPQADTVHFDTMRLNRLSDVIGVAGVSDFRVRPVISGATSINIVMETLSTPLNASV